MKAQEINKTKDLSKHSVYAEIGGFGILASYNYDFLFAKSIIFRIGGMPFPCGAANICVPNLFGNVNYLIRKSSNKFEFGLGLGTYFIGNVAPIIQVGYRYQPIQHGFNFRIGFTFLYVNKDFNENLIGKIGFPYLSYGYSF